MQCTISTKLFKNGACNDGPTQRNATLATKQKWHNGVSMPANVLEATAAHSNQALTVVCDWFMCDKMSVFCDLFAIRRW